MIRVLNVDRIAEWSRMARGISLAMIYYAQSGHPGGCLSMTDIASAIWLEKGIARENADSFDKNHLILSKGHSVPTLYALGYLSGLLSWEDVRGFRKSGSRLQGHPDSVAIEWLESSTGSLGQGLSVAAGLGIAKNRTSSEGRVYTILGDGELQEGQIWEAAAFASHNQIVNLTAFVDRNHLQSDSSTEVVMTLEPLREKWLSFGWEVTEIDGHDHGAILNALRRGNQRKPEVIICQTVKGRGVDFMENVPQWHGSVAMNAGQLESGLELLGFETSQIQKLLAGQEPA